jgi:hypothetical protein
LEKPLREGQPLQHERFGVGIATHSTETRTTIDFYEHGVKTFVTSMLEVELLPSAPERAGGTPRKPAREKKPKKS